MVQRSSPAVIDLTNKELMARKAIRFFTAPILLRFLSLAQNEMIIIETG